MTRRDRTDRRRSFASMVCCAIAAMSLVASPAHAQDDEDEIPDARLMGYGNNVNVSIGGGGAMSYFLTAVLGAICIGVMFKSSGRTHLD